MEKVKLAFSLNETEHRFIQFHMMDKPVIKPSSLGFILSGNDNFNSDFEITGSEKKSRMKPGNRFGAK